MRYHLIPLIWVAFGLGLSMGQWFFKRSWYKVYLILLFGREISLGMATPKRLRSPLH